MKTKILLAAAMIGAASLSAHAGVGVGISIGLPLPVPVVAVAPACPAPVVSTAYVTTPPCPGPNYGWVAGYWSVGAYGRVWVPGAWRYHGPVIVAGHGYYGAYGHVDARYGRGWR